MTTAEDAAVSTELDRPVFVFGEFSLDATQRLLFGADGAPVHLTARAFDTLLFLVEHPNQLIDKQTLLKAVWPNVIVEENNLSQNILIVRRALHEAPDEHRFIVTVPGRGFRFVAPVRRLNANPQPGALKKSTITNHTAFIEGGACKLAKSVADAPARTGRCTTLEGVGGANVWSRRGRNA